jgi:hypothetical protein
MAVRAGASQLPGEPSLAETIAALAAGGAALNRVLQERREAVR